MYLRCCNANTMYAVTLIVFTFALLKILLPVQRWASGNFVWDQRSTSSTTSSEEVLRGHFKTGIYRRSGNCRHDQCRERNSSFRFKNLSCKSKGNSFREIHFTTTNALRALPLSLKTEIIEFAVCRVLSLVLLPTGACADHISCYRQTNLSINWDYQVAQFVEYRISHLLV